MRIVPVALTAGLVLLAGCSGIIAGTDERTTPPTETVTAAPEPGATARMAGTEPTATAQPAAPYPPGIGEHGIADVSALWDAHQRVLEGTSYTLRAISSTERVDIGPQRRTVAVENQSRFLISGGSNGTGLIFVDRTGQYIRSVEIVEGRVVDVTDNVTVSDRDRDPPVLAGFELLSTGNGSVARIERDGQPYYRIHTTRTSGWMPSNVANYSMTAYVRPDGLVRAIAVSYDVYEWNHHARLHERYDYRTVGNTTVTEPAWVTRVKRNRSLGERNETGPPMPDSTATSASASPTASATPPANGTV